MQEPFKITTSPCWAQFSLANFGLELGQQATQNANEQQKPEKETKQNGTR